MSDAGHDAEALRLDIDLAFFVLVGTDFVAAGVISAEEVFAIPSVFDGGFFDLLFLFEDGLCFII